MTRVARRQYLTRSVAALGGVLAAACSLTESLWPGTGSPPRRAPPATLRVLYGQYGPGPGAMYTEIPVVWIGPDGRPETPDAEWFHTTVVTALMERYPDSTVSFESHHDPLNRALELHRAGTAPDIFQTDDLRNADLIRRRLAHRIVGRKRPRHPHRRYGRVDRAIRLRPRACLRRPPPEQKPRSPIVAALGV